VRVKVFVTPRQGILDPQGRAVEAALASLGFAGVSGVHLGRFVVFDIDRSQAAIEDAVKDICEQLLTNPIIEEYRFEVESE
jgi:phosphoribosylformylglycinamidine synthase